MSINIQLDGKLQKISGQTMTKEKIVEKLGYTPANEATVNADIAELDANLDAFENALEDYKNSMSDIDTGSADDEFVIADSSGNVIAKFDNEGLHTTSIEAESFTSNDKELAVYDDNGNAAFKVDENGITHAAKLELNSGDVDEQLGAISADLAEHDSNTTKHITADERTKWNNKSEFSGEFNDLKNSPITEDESGELIYADDAGNIIFKVAQDGGHTTELTLPGGKVDTRLNQLSADMSELEDDLETHTKLLDGDTGTPVHILPTERELWNSKVDANYVAKELAKLVDSAPDKLNTLDELAAALGDDENFANTVTEALSQKATQADLAEHTSDTDIHITPSERITWNNKSDVKSYYDLPDAPDITSEEDDSLLITDTSGNIVFKAGNLDKLDSDKTGIETTTIIAKEADIDNIYNKSEVDALLAEKSDDDHKHDISVTGTGDTAITVIGQGSKDSVHYTINHIKTNKAGAHTKVTVNEYGHITEGSTPTDIKDLGITNVYNKDEVDAINAAHETATTAHTKDQVGLGNVDNTSDIDKPISTATQNAIDGLKSELSESITSESDSWTIVDDSGNILLKAGVLDDNTSGLETTTLIAEKANIDNLYNKDEVDSLLAEKEDTHDHPYLPDTTTFAGSKSQGGPANSVEKSLKLKFNNGSTEGTNLFTYNGSSEKTVDITPGKIGAYTINEVDSLIAALQDKLDNALYEEIKINSFTTDKGTQARGTTITSVTLSWTTNKTPTSLTLDSTAIDASTKSKTISGLSIKWDNNKTWTLKATDEKGATSTTTATISFGNYIYYGVGTTENNFTSSFVTGLSKRLQTSKAYDFSVTPSNQYIYYAVPKRLGTVSFKVGGFEGGFESPSTVSITNSSSYTEDYYVYRSTNKLSGTTAIDVT